MPLGNGFTGPDPLGRGKGAAPDCVEKGPFGGGGGAPEPEPPVGWLPDPPAPPAPAVTVTMTWTVEVTVWTAGQPLDGLPGRPGLLPDPLPEVGIEPYTVFVAPPSPEPLPDPEPEPLPDPAPPVGADPLTPGPVVDGQMTSYVVLV